MVATARIVAPYGGCPSISPMIVCSCNAARAGMAITCPEPLASVADTDRRLAGSAMAGGFDPPAPVG
ncbi:MAG TPA: hypothetical protein VFB16_15100 [Bauldia sp.]|nr:hypothetical protein [Bauldia sp.]